MGNVTDQEKIKEISQVILLAGLKKMRELGNVGEHEYREALNVVIGSWLRIDGPFKIQKLEDMLYPHYQYKFMPFVSTEDFTWLQEEAVRRIKEHAMEKRTIDHLSDILEGKAPFGYDIVENIREC